MSVGKISVFLGKVKAVNKNRAIFYHARFYLYQSANQNTALHQKKVRAKYLSSLMDLFFDGFVLFW